jgi:hypothetical protein
MVVEWLCVAELRRDVPGAGVEGNRQTYKGLASWTPALVIRGALSRWSVHNHASYTGRQHRAPTSQTSAFPSHKVEPTTAAGL